MEDDCSTGQLKRAELTEASTPTISKRPRHDVLEESPLLLPSSDSLEKIDVPSASGANSDPSASYTSVIGSNYYVFLSFRGPDTRKNFVDHLYHELIRVGLHQPNFVFRDDESLRFGEPIAENLLSAIKRSKVSIPVISENYAASEWCLRELIQIMECKESREQIVLPVLYKVKPYEVREPKGAFGEAFKSRKDGFDEKVKQQGPVALRKALDLRVFESEKFANGHEAELIKELVRVIMGTRQHDFQPHLPVNLVGIDRQVAEVMTLVNIARPETRIIGIWGMGGIGKTTLATIIYNKLFDKFECRSFLKDIRETINRKGVEHVRSRLISDILKIHDHRVYDPDTGISMIQSSCTQKMVLFLLDDVDHPNQLDNLIGGCKFSLGSRIIFTSRHKAINCQDKFLLESTYWYELKKMNIRNSLLLFSIHAFEKKPPPKQLATLSRDIVAIIGGLPLALTVIGSHLKGEEDQGIWGEMLEKLRSVPDEEVQQQLRISYDLLEHVVKQMFLDIACFFIGIDKRIAPYLWDHKLCPRTGLKKLIDRSLIYVDYENDLTMHDELRDLGRAITRPADKKLWDCSRLWEEEAMIVLSRKEENENIEALRLDRKGSKEFMERKSFKKMPNLKFLHLNDVGFAGDFEGSLSELRWLKLEGCPDSFKATNFHLEKLIVLDLSGSENCISENWRGWSSIKMERLKVLNLSWCWELKSTPNLSVFKNLELLILKGCNDLKEIHPSIGDVKRLIFLNLSCCESLKKLPEQLGELENLEELVIDNTRINEIPPCIGSLKKLKRFSARMVWERDSSLEHIPSSIGKLGELVELDLEETKIKELPESIGELTKLKILNISRTHVKRLPSSIGKLQSLEEFHANECYNLEGQILVDKGGLSSLKTLDLNHTKISGLPENLDQLSSLEHLDLGGCGKLQSLPKPPFSLVFLRLTWKGNELPSLSHLQHLQKLGLFRCDSLQSIPSLSNLKHLQELTLSSCMSLQSIPSLPHHLQKLTLHDCMSLQSIPSLSHPKHLQELTLDYCEFLQSIPSLSHLKHLQKLDIFFCDSLQSIPSLSHLQDLQELTLKSCMSLQRIPELPSCIRTLDVSQCPELERLANLSDLEFLLELRLKYCNGLKQLDGLEALKSLRELNLSIHPELFNLDGFDAKADKLHAIRGLEKLESLEVVDISRRKHIQVLDLSKSEHLKELIVRDCESLVEICCPSKFLEHFDRDRCELLKKLPDFLPHDRLWSDLDEESD